MVLSTQKSPVVIVCNGAISGQVWTPPYVSLPCSGNMDHREQQNCIIPTVDTDVFCKLHQPTAIYAKNGRLSFRNTDLWGQISIAFHVSRGNEIFVGLEKQLETKKALGLWDGLVSHGELLMCATQRVVLLWTKKNSTSPYKQRKMEILFGSRGSISLSSPSPPPQMNIKLKCSDPKLLQWESRLHRYFGSNWGWIKSKKSRFNETVLFPELAE